MMMNRIQRTNQRMFYPNLVNRATFRLREKVASKPYSQISLAIGEDNLDLLLQYKAVAKGRVDLKALCAISTNPYFIDGLKANGLILRKNETEPLQIFEAIAGRCMEKNGKNFKLLHEFRQIRPKEVDDEVNEYIKKFDLATKGELSRIDYDIILEVGADLFNNYFWSTPIVKLDSSKLQLAIMDSLFKRIESDLHVKPWINIYRHIIDLYTNLFLLFPRFEFTGCLPESVIDIILARIDALAKRGE